MLATRQTANIYIGSKYILESFQILGCFRSSMASLLPEEIKIGPYVQELLNAILLSALSKSITLLILLLRFGAF